MKLRFWGSRGSAPTPISPEAVRRKIVSVIQRARPEHLESDQSRLSFLKSLPDWLYGTVGGNTSCLELEMDDGGQIIFDAGTGIVELGKANFARKEPRKEFHIFFTHFHYDHIQGFPLFGPAYDPSVSLHFYSPVPNFEKMLRNQMMHPYFPITMEGKMSPHVSFHQLSDEEPVELYGAKVTFRKLNHPGVAYGYRVEHNQRIFAYISDVELLPADFEQTEDNKRFFSGVHTMVLDTPYTLGEAIEKYNWGHSSFTHGVEFANTWSAEILFLFHHEPRYDDQRLQLNLQSARWYAKSLGNYKLKIYLSAEGKEQEI